MQAPKGAPNVLLILLDDTGFGQYGTFGGGIPSPTMDKLAAEGIRYNRFHTTALCSPTRAAIITGRNHHSVGFASIAEGATGYEGYTCVLPRSCGTIGEVLRQNGYMTAWVRKNHNTPGWEGSAAGPFDRWANGLGFDYFYGFNAGEGSVNENLFFNGFPEKREDNMKAFGDLGGPKYFNHFPSALAHAMSTPFQWTKQVASHFGGTRNPMIISWPAKIKDKGGLRSQFIHTIDIVPTLYELIGVTPPDQLNGISQKPIEGISFASTFNDVNAKATRKTQ